MTDSAMSIMVIGGSGYIGAHLVVDARTRGHRVVSVGRHAGHDGAVIEHAAALDDLLVGTEFDQIVCTPRLTENSVDWILDRIDGPRWIVLSSAQVSSAVAAPGVELAAARERVALRRGAVVLRPTMVFGHSAAGRRDKNVSSVAALVSSTKLPVSVGPGSQLVQPLHLDDLAELVEQHRTVRPPSGLFSVGGAEQLPARELLGSICELTGVRTPIMTLPTTAVGVAARAAVLIGVRRDQLMRLVEDKTVDDAETRKAFRWEPAPLAHRLEQAVGCGA